MRFEFATAGRIIFGPGVIAEVGALSAGMGNRAFVITGKTVERANVLFDLLDEQGIKYAVFSVSGEPTTVMATEAVRQARKAQSDIVVSIGGGSAMDTGKVVAAMLANSAELVDYLEVVGKGKPLTKSCAPHIAIPTTAGTGTEVTRNSVLSVPGHGVKVSMRHESMLPSAAVVDPVLTYSMPADVTAYTGLDALTQLIEAYTSNKANPLTDGICKEGLRCARRSLRKVYEDGSDKAGREDMAIASLFSGLALANAKLGAVHGIAGPMGGMIDAPHGVICARLLPFVFEMNVRTLRARQVDSEALVRYDEISRILTQQAAAKAADGLLWLQELCAVFKVPPLGEFGLKEQDLPQVVAKTHNSSSMKGNPITLTDDELSQILKKAL